MSSVQVTCGGLGHDGDGQGDGLVRRLEAESRRRERPTVLTTGNQGDVVALLEQAGPDRAADGTGSQDDEAHACTLPRPAVASFSCGGDACIRTCRRPRRERGRDSTAPGRWAGGPGPWRHGAQRPAGHRHRRRARRDLAVIPTRPSRRPTGSPGGSTPTCPPCSSAASSALLLQTLHPLAMAGVADHSGYRDDPLGRLRRTAQFVGHHDLRHDGPGRRGGGPGAAGAPAGQGHLPRRPQVLGGRSRAGDLHPRGGGLELPGLLAALRAA